MWHPFEAVPLGKRKWIFLPLLFLTLVIMGILEIVSGPLRTQGAPRGIISFELAGSVSTVSTIIDSWNHSARIAAAFSLGLDFLFLLTYSTTIGFACMWAAALFRAHGWPLALAGIVLAWGQWLAALLDAVENFALLTLLKGSLVEPWPQIAWLCAVPKFVLVVAGLAYVVLGVVVRFTGLKASKVTG